MPRLAAAIRPFLFSRIPRAASFEPHAVSLQLLRLRGSSEIIRGHRLNGGRVKRPPRRSEMTYVQTQDRAVTNDGQTGRAPL